MGPLNRVTHPPLPPPLFSSALPPSRPPARWASPRSWTEGGALLRWILHRLHRRRTSSTITRTSCRSRMVLWPQIRQGDMAPKSSSVPLGRPSSSCTAAGTRGAAGAPPQATSCRNTTTAPLKRSSSRSAARFSRPTPC
jgi:hypothetical protein